MPGNSAAEELIKTGSETITDRNYERFFAFVARRLGPLLRTPRQGSVAGPRINMRDISCDDWPDRRPA